MNGHLHGETRSFVDINAVDCRGIDGGNGPCNSALANAIGQNLPPLRFNLFAVVQTADGRIRRQNDGSGDDGSEERAAPNLIGARYETETARAQFPLESSLTFPVFCGSGHWRRPV